MDQLENFFRRTVSPAKEFTPDNLVMMPNWAVQDVRNWLTQSKSHTNPYASQFSTETQKECIEAYERGRLQLIAELLENLYCPKNKDK